MKSILKEKTSQKQKQKKMPEIFKFESIFILGIRNRTNLFTVSVW